MFGPHFVSLGITALIFGTLNNVASRPMVRTLNAEYASHTVWELNTLAENANRAACSAYAVNDSKAELFKVYALMHHDLDDAHEKAKMAIPFILLDNENVRQSMSDSYKGAMGAAEAMKKYKILSPDDVEARKSALEEAQKCSVLAQKGGMGLLKPEMIKELPNLY